MTLDATLIRAIAKAVEAQGGDYSDVQDLIAVWERLASDPHGRLDRLRFENEQRRKALSEGPGA